MSVTVSAKVWTGFPYGGSRLLVVLAMADYANSETGMIFPSMATLAAKVRMNEDATRRIVKQLVKDGWLTVVKQGVGGDQRNTTHYQINLNRLETPCAGAPPAPAHPLRGSRQPPAPQSVTPCAGACQSGINREEPSGRALARKKPKPRPKRTAANPRRGSRPVNDETRMVAAMDSFRHLLEEDQ